jgi:tryptophan synthase alpha chain
MNGSASVAEAFARRRLHGESAFIPYLVAGDPMLDAMPSLLEAACAGGADIIEIGLPYSDPLADGPTIAAAADRALRGGATFDAVLEAIQSFDRGIVTAPLVAFTYFNPLLVRGIDRSARDLAAAGFAGVIVPDLPPEESALVRERFNAAGLSMTYLIAPTTPASRFATIAACCSDFIYVVSRVGVTGAAAAPSENTENIVGQVRKVTDKPVAVGFGIATPEQAAAVARFADGVVVGSALVDRVAAAKPGEEAAAVRDCCSSLTAAMRGVRR